jgi:alkanesulfonate monooxygenase SsuD/methylene tetrahydromethanopterin reductase-like flavin-dependent oxidoreductase (luciferase family)
MHRRGRIFDRQLADLDRHWRGETGVGPESRPTLLIGGRSDATFRRAARHGDGWTSGGGGPDAFAQALATLNEAWAAAGREGRPRTMALAYFALGDGAAEQAAAALGDYYGFAGDYAEQIIAGAATDPDTVRERTAGFAAAGADELVWFPTSSDPAQVDLLADAAL